MCTQTCALYMPGIAAVYFISRCQLAAVQIADPLEQVYIAAGFSILLMVALKRWIPFTTTMIKAGVLVVRSEPSLMLVAGCSLVLQVLWLVVWAYALAGSAAQGDTISIFILVTTHFWTQQVLKNVVHVTAAGTAASWYFQTREPSTPFLCFRGAFQINAATTCALRRALTSSFGSICLGSLIIAVLRTLRLLIPSRAPQSRNPIFNLLCVLAMCVSGFVENAMLIYNHLGFTFVAIYGYEYAQAGREAFALVKQVGLEPLVNMVLLQVRQCNRVQLNCVGVRTWAHVSMSHVLS